MQRPYSQTVSVDSIMHRTFPADTPTAQLVWHRDKNDRLVTVVESDGWQLQIDNELPVLLEVGSTYYIKKDCFHRVIKGNGPLRVSIKEN
jgi:hypothetical protein